MTLAMPERMARPPTGLPRFAGRDTDIACIIAGPGLAVDVRPDVGRLLCRRI